jgi:hypothetical protein
VGGILKANGFTDFLANYGNRKTADDPVRRGLGILGSTNPNVWLDVGEWAKQVVDLGLEKAVIPPADQGTDAGRRRGIGVVMSNHRDESLVVETDSGSITLQLKKERRRFDGGEPQLRYKFESIEKKEDAS